MIKSIILFLGIIISSTAFAWTNPSANPTQVTGAISISGGNLGVGGVTSPSQSLQIKSSADNGTYPLDITDSSGNRRAAIYMANGNPELNLFDSGGTLRVKISPYANNPSYINVSGGNLGIGTTAPEYKLHIAGTAYFAGDTTVYGNLAIDTSGGQIKMRTGTVSAPGLQINGDPNTGVYSAAADTLNVSTAGANHITVLPSGNVGFGSGATAPDGSFYVRNAAGGVFKFMTSGELYVGGTIAQQGAESYMGSTIVNYSSNTDLTVQPRTTSKNLILATGTGNVGIGTTSPKGKLDVGATGNIIFGNATEKIDLNGNYVRLSGRGLATSARSIWFGRLSDASDSLAIDTDAVIFEWRKGIEMVGDVTLNGQFSFSGSGYYLMLQGKTIYGATTTSGNLTLNSTSNATKGFVFLNPSGGSVGVATTSPGATFAVNGAIYTNTGFRFPDGSMLTNGAGLGAWSKSGNYLYLTTSSDNVGIGTSSPTEKLYVDSGNIGVDEGYSMLWGGAAISTLNYNNGLYKLYYNGDNDGSLGINLGSNIINIYSTGNSSNLTFGANDYSRRIVITPAGNIGISSTDPGTELDVTGRARFSQGIQITGVTTFPAGTGIILRDQTNYKEIQSFDVSPLALNPAGNNVGIGTTAPTALFMVSSSGTDQAVFRSTDTSYGTMGVDVGGTGIPNVQFKQAGTSKAAIGVNNAGQLIFGITNTTGPKMIIGSNGNVGVGSTTPMAQLHVAGNIPSAAAGSTSTGSTPGSVFIQGRYAYVLNSVDRTLQIFDVSNPSAPISKGTATTIGASQDRPQNLYVQGKYAYLAVDHNYGSEPGTIQIFDVSNPTAPTNISMVTAGDIPVSVYVQDKYAYVVNYGTTDTFKIFDISNPFQPTQIGTINTTYYDPTSVFVQGRYAYIVYENSSRLEIFDISNPATPISTGSVNTGANGATAVYVQGRYAYIAMDGNFKIVDISNPAAPANKGSLSIVGFEIVVQGKYAYLADARSNVIRVIDVSNVDSPVLIGSMGTGGWPGSLAVQGRYAYVVNGTSNTLQVFDLGGAYIQQLEAGGIETGTLSIRTNASINNDLDIRGGLQIGGGLAAYGASSFFSTSTDSVFTVGRKGATYPTVFKQGTDGAFVLNNNNADVMTLKSSKIGIGTTTPSLSYGTLTVGGTGLTISDDGNAKLQIGRYSAANDYSYFKLTPGSFGFKFSSANDSSDLVIIDSNGVDLGTSDADSHKLDVNGTLNATSLYENGTALSASYVARNNWATHDSYPSACAAGTFLTGIGDTLTCGFSKTPFFSAKTSSQAVSPSQTTWTTVTVPAGNYSCNTGYYNVSVSWTAGFESDITQGSWAEAAVGVDGSPRCVNSKPYFSSKGNETWAISCMVYCSGAQTISMMMRSNDTGFTIQSGAGSYLSVVFVSY
ncbi:MAG: hypothetical protein PHN74_01195 [Candidatus Pacebacteria bacterium]|nr:hypothetical protein [Candidatus Paceibacterota bacterium]